MGKRELRMSDTTQKYLSNTSVTGITCGKVNNRQLIIYDKRAEVLAKRKAGWPVIWNHKQAAKGLPPLDIKDRNASRVWRVEARLGSKCLRGRWEIRGWDDLDAMVGDAFTEILKKIRYTIVGTGQNRSLWPDHELWGKIREIFNSELHRYRSGVVPSEVKTANRAAFKEMMDMQALGIIISRAVAEEVDEKGFYPFLRNYVENLKVMSERHSIPLEDRIERAQRKRIF